MSGAAPPSAAVARLDLRKTSTPAPTLSTAAFSSASCVAPRDAPAAQQSLGCPPRLPQPRRAPAVELAFPSSLAPPPASASRSLNPESWRPPSSSHECSSRTAASPGSLALEANSLSSAASGAVASTPPDDAESALTGRPPVEGARPRSLEARRRAAAARARAAAAAFAHADLAQSKGDREETGSSPREAECSAAGVSPSAYAASEGARGDAHREATFSETEAGAAGLLSALVSDATAALKAGEDAREARRVRGGGAEAVGFRLQLTRRILEREADRMLLLGTANYLVVLGKSLGLSSRCISVGCVYLHLFFDSFFFRGLERKCAAAACLLLSWKYAEDGEESRCTRKLYDLARGMYRVSVQQKVSDLREVRSRLLEVLGELKRGRDAPGLPPKVLAASGASPSVCTSPGREGAPSRSHAEALVETVLAEEALEDLASSSRWLLCDSAISFRIICHKLRIYESALLRALRFNVGPVHLPFAALRLYVKAFLTKCPSTSSSSSASSASSSSSFASSSDATRRPPPGQPPCQPPLSPDAAGALSPRRGARCCCACWPGRGLRYAQLQRSLHEGALREFLLISRTPFVLERPATALAAACVVRAAILARLPASGVDSTAERAQPTEETAVEADAEVRGDSKVKAETDGKEEAAVREGEARRREEAKVLDVLAAFSAHVESFLGLVNDPLGAAQREASAGEDGDASEESSSSAAAEEAAGPYAVDAAAVKTALADLRQAAQWQDDLLNDAFPAFPLPFAAETADTGDADAAGGEGNAEEKADGGEERRREALEEGRKRRREDRRGDKFEKPREGREHAHADAEKRCARAKSHKKAREESKPGARERDSREEPRDREERDQRKKKR
ncbi:hypothetical protein BESB_014500 [Besnoitia besnoiti]|uniref:Cyclin N-terminal domain-containing protein n=1 Tax=Besnoitia besnoiti TaxID=94643 RepID=A0A2A9MB35_BESBE|nr:hypothetical protein BESB_014500 [Besnoitia besnoiti]PFH32837.1 hypothetical protein BESB_014500 [Besnoitia besnoiti]